MNSFFKAFWSIYFLISVNPLTAQNTYIKFDHITTENGLPQEHVFAVLEDKKGFLWIGMESGLARYDGYSFKTYTHDPSDSTSISSNIVRVIFQDEQGSLWVGTDGGGVSRYNHQNDEFTNFKHDPNNSNSLSGNRVHGIAADANGTIWVATLASGLNRIVLEQSENSRCDATACFTRFRYNPSVPTSLADDNIWTMIIDSKNRLWAGTVSAGLDMLNLNIEGDGNGIFKHFESKTRAPFSLSGNSVKSIYEDRKGTLWVGTEFKGLNRFNDEDEKFDSWQFDQTNPNSVSHNHVSCLLEDSDGNFWVGTNGGGVNIFDRENETFTPFKNTPEDPYSLNGNLVNTIHQSSKGILWLGMVNKGLNWIDPQKQLIKHFYPIPGQLGSLNGNLIKAIYEDKKGEIWVGAYNSGLSHFNSKTDKFTSHLQSVVGSNVVKNNVQRIYEDTNENLWIGTDGGGLFLFDRKNKSFSDFNKTASGSELSGKAIWAICEDLKGNIWIGTADGGLSQFNWQSKQFRHFGHDPNNSNGLNSNDIRVVFEDHLGILWIGTYGGGLNRYNPIDETFIHYTTEKGKKGNISNDIITHIFESPLTQQLWIGTFGGGLNRFDRVTGSFMVYQEKDGLANDVVKSIEEDSEGNLWISTLKGISKFNPNSETFVNYTTSHGLQGNGFNLGASCFSQTGAMYFGGTNGLNIFFPDRIKKQVNESYNSLVTDLKIFNRSIQPGENIRNKTILQKVIDETKAISIPYFINDFTFEFAALDFADSDNIKYAYQLEGATNDDWHYNDASRRYASFSNLASGDYTFKVKASNTEGLWNGQVTQIAVTILPAPWQTIWAYVLYTLIFLSLIYLFRKYELARFKLKNELNFERLERQKNKELNKMKLRFFTNISHEIRTPLTLILSPIQELITSGDLRQEVRAQLTNINRNANRLLLLVNQLLEFRKQEAGHAELQVAKGDFVKSIMEIILSFKEFAHHRNIDFSFNHQPDKIDLWYDRNKMENVFFNVLSNAFKFTPDGGKIDINITKEEKIVRIVIEDTGKGISKEDLPHIFERFHKFDKDYSGNYLGSGIGLALVKKLVGLHHGTIWAESEEDVSTRFVIELPLGVKHFKEEEIISDHKGSEHAIHYKIENQDGDFEPTSLPPSADAPTLLIVEDNEDVRNYLKKLFLPQCHILEASNGKIGWDVALKHLPDLIISDVLMPEMDGLQFCRKSKTTLETSHIPIILLTARASILYQTEGMETGADDYLTKPFNPTLLKLRVKNLITSRKRLREKFSQNLALEPHEIAITSPDQSLLRRAIDAVEKHMDDAEFDVSMLAKEIGISRPVLYRKLPAITDNTPNEFIRIIRLKRAAQILTKVDISISDVCYQTGFKTPKYFSKCFRDFFGILPSQYAKQNKERIIKESE